MLARRPPSRRCPICSPRRRCRPGQPGRGRSIRYIRLFASKPLAAGGSASDPRVRATLDRLRLLPATGRAILVDVASAELWMLENGQPVDSMKVVVGKTTSPTPLLAGTINYVTFNPYWHILDDVARRKVAPIVAEARRRLSEGREDTTPSRAGAIPSRSIPRPSTGKPSPPAPITLSSARGRA